MMTLDVETSNNLALLAGFVMVIPCIFSSLIPDDVELSLMRLGVILYIGGMMFRRSSK